MTNKIFLQWSQIRRKVAGISGHALDGEVPDVWAPNTDVCEGPDGVVIRMELPGVPLKDLELSYEGSVININGVRKDLFGEETIAGFRFRQLEIEYGPFHRAVTLPYPVDADLAKASVRNGMLEIRIRKPKTVRPSTINVNEEL